MVSFVRYNKDEAFIRRSYINYSLGRGMRIFGRGGGGLVTELYGRTSSKNCLAAGLPKDEKSI